MILATPPSPHPLPPSPRAQTKQAGGQKSQIPGAESRISSHIEGGILRWNSRSVFPESLQPDDTVNDVEGGVQGEIRTNPRPLGDICPSSLFCSCTQRYWLLVGDRDFDSCMSKKESRRLLILRGERGNRGILVQLGAIEATPIPSITVEREKNRERKEYKISYDSRSK